MKVGILTFHRAYNYGAVLQCYALQETLRQMGHEARVIDYVQPSIEEVNDSFKLNSYTWATHLVKLQWSKAYRQLRFYRFRRRIKRNFCTFREHYLKMTAPCSGQDDLPQDFDIYVVGSDQLWSWELLKNQVDQVFLGNFPRPANSRLVGYAISATPRSLEQLGHEGLKEVKERFDRLSMREDVAAKTIETIIGEQVPVCCDPTLLTDASFWEPITSNRYAQEDYVLLYRLRGDEQLLNSKGQLLAERLGCRLVNMPNDARIEDFVSLFRHAKYVITTSFHGTAFSLIFGRPLYAVKLNDRWDARYENLLHILGADYLCVDKDFDPVPMEVDYTPIHAAMKGYAQCSRDFLRDLAQ